MYVEVVKQNESRIVGKNSICNTKIILKWNEYKN